MTSATNAGGMNGSATRVASTVRLHPLAERALVAVFLVVLALPAVGTVLGIARANAAEENRTLAPFPSLRMTWASWRAFPEGFTRYFEDNFAFRPALVRWQAMLRFKALDVSPSSSVVKGTDGWWFYADDGAMQDYAESPPFTTAELEVWRHTLQDTRDWLRQRGIAYVFVLAPDKHQVYPEHMPAAIRRAPQSRIDQLVAYLRERSTVPVLDLRPALWRAKRDERIYHLTDTHWNDLGAHVAYAQILSSLAHEIPALSPRPRAAFKTTPVSHHGLDLAQMMGLARVLAEEGVTLAPRRRTATVIEPQTPNAHGIEARLVTEVQGSTQPRAVVFRDSFASSLIPFLSEHFSRAVYLWQYNVDPAVIEQERPDVVIQELVGRRLSTIAPYNPFESLAADDATDDPRAGRYGRGAAVATSGDVDAGR
jgi:alginate O-acetyltransferase complex protein AlgJ